MSSRKGQGKAKELIEWIRSKDLVCITFHRNADPDAVASAVALKALAKKVSGSTQAVIVSTEGVELPSRKALELLGIDAGIIPYDQALGCEHYVIVDTSTKTQLPAVAEELRPGNYVVIDHHEINDLTKDAAAAIHDPGSASTSEIVARIIKDSGILPDKKVLTLLIVGVLYDTKFLRLATAETLETVAWLMRAGGSYSKAITALTSRTTTRSERIAKLKGIARTGLYTLNKTWVMAITCIGAHESAVLKTLMDAGADVSIAVAKRKGLTRVTVRVTNELINEVGKPVAAELCRELGESLGGVGGGHAGAAGAIIEKEVEPEKLLNAVRKYFRSLGLKVKALEEGRWKQECG